LTTTPALRVLQVGLGARGRRWAGLVRRSPTVVPAAYVDPRPDTAAWAAEHGEPGTPVFADVAEAARAVEADFALVVTPPFGRRALLNVLFDRGLPVLCEKPLAADLGEAVEINRDAEQRGLLFGVVQNFRYLPASQWLRDTYQSRRYGPVTFVALTYVRTRDGYAPHLNRYCLEMADSMLLEQSIHHLDLARYVYDSEVASVQCHTWNPANSMYRGDAAVAALLRFENGIAMTYHGTWTSGRDTLDFTWRTDMTRGAVVQRDLVGDVFEASMTDGAYRPVPLPPAEPMLTDTAGLLEDFAACVADGRGFTASGRDHLKTLALTFACLESQRTGCRVDVRAFGAARGVL